jgi:hypothetical protein
MCRLANAGLQIGRKYSYTARRESQFDMTIAAEPNARGRSDVACRRSSITLADCPRSGRLPASLNTFPARHPRPLRA